jgi:hypothetical protein
MMRVDPEEIISGLMLYKILFQLNSNFDIANINNLNIIQTQASRIIRYVMQVPN